MLRNIPSVLSPKVVYELMKMGHGDTLVIADANFPGHRVNENVVRADGLGVPEILEAILQLMPLDPYNSWQVGLMETVEGDPKPTIWQNYTQILDELNPEYKVKKFERFDFYDQARKASLVVMTGETALYANIILTKGVIT